MEWNMWLLAWWKARVLAKAAGASIFFMRQHCTVFLYKRKDTTGPTLIRTATHASTRVKGLSSRDGGSSEHTFKSDKLTFRPWMKGNNPQAVR